MKCKCGAEIKFVKLKSGKLMPFDTIKTKVLLENGEIHDGYISHFITCKFSNEFRKNIKTKSK